MIERATLAPAFLFFGIIVFALPLLHLTRRLLIFVVIVGIFSTAHERAYDMLTIRKRNASADEGNVYATLIQMVARSACTEPFPVDACVWSSFGGE